MTDGEFALSMAALFGLFTLLSLVNHIMWSRIRSARRSAMEVRRESRKKLDPPSSK